MRIDANVSGVFLVTSDYFTIFIVVAGVRTKYMPHESPLRASENATLLRTRTPAML